MEGEREEKKREEEREIEKKRKTGREDKNKQRGGVGGGRLFSSQCTQRSVSIVVAFHGSLPPRDRRGAYGNPASSIPPFLAVCTTFYPLFAPFSAPHPPSRPLNSSLPFLPLPLLLFLPPSHPSYLLHPPGGCLSPSFPCLGSGYEKGSETGTSLRNTVDRCRRFLSNFRSVF